jgi:Tfp pilus assembly protein PilN
MLIAGFNLASLDYRQSRRRTLLVAAGVAGLALVLALQIVLWAGLRRDAGGIGQRLAQMEDQIRRHEEEVRAIRATIPEETLKRYQTRVAAYNQILEASAFSWTRLLIELEHAVPPGVHLREIQPDPSSGRVSLSGEARSFDDIARLVRGLAERTSFRDVYLLRQSVRTGSTGGGEMQDFSVSLTYQGRPS